MVRLPSFLFWLTKNWYCSIIFTTIPAEVERGKGSIMEVFYKILLILMLGIGFSGIAFSIYLLFSKKENRRDLKIKTAVFLLVYQGIGLFGYLITGDFLELFTNGIAYFIGAFLYAIIAVILLISAHKDTERMSEEKPPEPYSSIYQEPFQDIYQENKPVAEKNNLKKRIVVIAIVILILIGIIIGVCCLINSYSNSNNNDEYPFDEEEYLRLREIRLAFGKLYGSESAYNFYSSELDNITADKDMYGNEIEQSREMKVTEYLNNLHLDYGLKIILYRTQFINDNTYCSNIVDYLNERDDITYDEMKTILIALGMRVDSEGNIYWD